MSAPDDERQVELYEDDLEILPDTPFDERDAGWGGSLVSGDDTARLLEERPPHWD
ncbi:hypothetical protein F4561_004060 [Lipingzhangella halophila]|uniref:Uncharacterized protein n=1 Tax=Lipingzhangella halophila TaxID=1783352 RepID=A0A7W7W4Z7_9ACTN|nr:hypothetical protein [Lipingzhangella halophila]MBB4933240.1 hypothetical protein [Lipingzhangella halophila]